MKNKLIALVPGDGSGPEMMKVACKVVQKAGLLDNINVKFEEKPMGWRAFSKVVS